jgi:hypothetical protein
LISFGDEAEEEEEELQASVLTSLFAVLPVMIIFTQKFTKKSKSMHDNIKVLACML